ncbi:MAG TPA: gliding motility-associated C-terminal domain-containing protein, partial [Phnomibacter sp.]|nr:gliding motility-associated C-terminal domain-containing protein [Phnomibacter sp.]
NHPTLTGYSYRWVSDTLGTGPTLATSFVLGNIGKGKYYFYLKDSKGCEQLGTVRNINGFDKPVINTANVKVADETCSSMGSISGISILQTPSIPYSLVWQDASNNVIGNSLNISGIPKGTYLLTLTDSFQCKVSATFTIQKTTPLLQLPSYSNVSVKRGGNAKIIPSNIQSPGTYNLFAANNSTVPSQKNNTGSFEIKQVQRDSTVYVSYENQGCQSEKVAINIKVYDEVMVTPPNAFSPNGDGINDVWLIRSQGVQQLERLQIFDRYGKIVFETIVPQNGWNGTSNGGVVPAGTYYYLLDYKAESGGKFQQKGSVLVIK